jgi:hypothetical protein
VRQLPPQQLDAAQRLHRHVDHAEVGGGCGTDRGTSLHLLAGGPTAGIAERSGAVAVFRGGASGPAFARKVAELLLRIAANDREIEYVNNHARPSGAARLLVAELIARGLEGFVKNAVRTPRITEELRLPAFEHSAHQPYACPRTG